MAQPYELQGQSFNMTPDSARIRVGIGRDERHTHRGHPIGHTSRVTEPRNYVKYTFLRVDPAWRRRSSEERAADKREFAAACRDFGEDHYLRVYSMVGTRGDCDLMVRAISRKLEPIHELHVLLNQSGLMRYSTIAHLPRHDQGVALLGRAGQAAGPARGGRLEGT